MSRDAETSWDPAPADGQEQQRLSSVSTAPGTLTSMLEGRRKSSVPLPHFLQRRATTAGQEPVGMTAHRHHSLHGHLPHVNVGQAFKRIKRVMFASVSHIYHDHDSRENRDDYQPAPTSPSTSVESPRSSPPFLRPHAPTPTRSAPTANGLPKHILRTSASGPHLSTGYDDRSSPDDFSLSDDEDGDEGLVMHAGNQSNTRHKFNCDAIFVTISALYCKLLVVVGLAFPLSEVISTDIPPFYYESFYVYLYSCSILFLLCVYVFLLIDSTASEANPTASRLSKISSAVSINRLSRLLRMESREADSRRDPETASQVSRSSHHRPYMVMVASYGSFYLRMGAVLFGIGSMIYSGLEMGQYFQEMSDDECNNIMGAVTPGLRLAFIFIQMYFIFLNASMSINRHKLIARFGLMHMVGTNLCVWLHVVIQETKHELIHLLSKVHGHDEHRRRRGVDGHAAANALYHAASEAIQHAANSSHGLLTHVPDPDPSNRQLMEDLEEFYAKEGGHLTKCARSDIMGQLVDSASPFLFPCTIEYSLICAATLYVMWKNLNRMNTVYVLREVGDPPENTRKHQYSVDCARASKGLFLGILVFVAAIISLILFFVFINKPGRHELAILAANMTELVLYSVTVLAIVIGMVQIQRLKYRSDRNIELDNILLVVAQTGVYLYGSFHIIGAHFSADFYSFATGVMSIIQVTMQTMFILDASRRHAYRSNQLRDKPGREVVTFLLICNLAMWCITTFETSRSDAHPKQLHFFGFWAWTIISHISMPLAIFYRFHSTVCLCDIWKRAYKYKSCESDSG